MQTTASDPGNDRSGAPAQPAVPAGAARGREVAGVRLLWAIVVLVLLAGAYAWYDQRRTTQV